MVEFQVGNGGGEAEDVPVEDAGGPVSVPELLTVDPGDVAADVGPDVVPQTVEFDPTLEAEDGDPGLPEPQPLDGPDASQGTVELGRGNGGELGVMVATIVPEVITVGAVPVGPALPAVLFGNGNGAEVDKMDDGFEDPVPKPDE
jgi:hypothetical protein